jgi:hypothetical protein
VGRGVGCGVGSGVGCGVKGTIENAAGPAMRRSPLFS